MAGADAQVLFLCWDWVAARRGDDPAHDGTASSHGAYAVWIYRGHHQLSPVALVAGYIHWGDSSPGSSGLAIPGIQLLSECGGGVAGGLCLYSPLAQGDIWFFASLVFLGVLFALGKNTPVFRLFYDFPYLGFLGIPSLGRFFDIPSRFLALPAFGLALLAGYGIDSLAESAVRGNDRRLTRQGRRIIGLLAAGCILYIILFGLMALNLRGDLIRILLDPSTPSPYYANANFSAFTLIFGLFTLAFLLGKIRKRIFQALLLFVTVADLLHSGSQLQVEFDTPKELYRPPVAVRYLQERVDPSLRVMGFDALKTVGGDIRYTRFRSILMPNLALLYRLQDVSGYDPLILQRYSELVERTVGQAPGEIPLRVVAWAGVDSPLLDLLRVGYVVGEVHERRVFSGQMELRPGERRALKIAVDRPAREMRFRSVMTGGILIKQGTQVGEILLRDASGEQRVFPIRAGKETADVYVEVAHAHHPAEEFRSWSQVLEIQGKKNKYRVHNYVSTLSFERPFRPVEMEISNQTDSARLAILGVALTEESTDRFELEFESGKDRVYRNRDVLPLAWWVHQVHYEPSARGVLTLMEQNRLPDGTPIDYRNWALIESLLPYNPEVVSSTAEDKVEIIRWTPDRLEIQAESTGAGLVVFSEIDYPGWRARVNGKPEEILTVNYVLRAVALPAGSHRIEMIYAPRSFYFGLAASALGVILILLLFLRLRREYPSRGYDLHL